MKNEKGKKMEQSKTELKEKRGADELDLVRLAPGANLPHGSVLAVRREDGENGEVLYALFAVDGADREEFGTACARCYGLYIRDREGGIFLPDLAREEAEARALFSAMADGAVSSAAALEAADALLG